MCIRDSDKRTCAAEAQRFDWAEQLRTTALQRRHIKRLYFRRRTASRQFTPLASSAPPQLRSRRAGPRHTAAASSSLRTSSVRPSWRLQWAMIDVFDGALLVAVGASVKAPSVVDVDRTPVPTHPPLSARSADRPETDERFQSVRLERTDARVSAWLERSRRSAQVLMGISMDGQPERKTRDFEPLNRVLSALISFRRTSHVSVAVSQRLPRVIRYVTQAPAASTLSHSVPLTPTKLLFVEPG